MIDYLEDLLEEEGAVELTGRPLLPVGRRTASLWEEELSLRSGPSSRKGTPAEGAVGQGRDRLTDAGRPSWAEEAVPLRSAGVRLLEDLRRAELAAGAIRQQAKPLTVPLTGERPQAGSLDLQAMDRAVQRDARRYDGGFSLY
ncbi:MAG: hypothetical protein IKY34_00935 [Ruminiclostridium sp.]|nr:hypothetical protein [Ruminiclostridium sp.]